MRRKRKEEEERKEERRKERRKKRGRGGRKEGVSLWEFVNFSIFRLRKCPFP